MLETSTSLKTCVTLRGRPCPTPFLIGAHTSSRSVPIASDDYFLDFPFASPRGVTLCFAAGLVLRFTAGVALRFAARRWSPGFATRLGGDLEIRLRSFIDLRRSVVLTELSDGLRHKRRSGTFHFHRHEFLGGLFGEPDVLRQIPSCAVRRGFSRPPAGTGQDSVVLPCRAAEIAASCLGS